jgi:hypothetical protein
MVLYVFAGSFFTPLGEKRTYKGKSPEYRCEQS